MDNLELETFSKNQAPVAAQENNSRLKNISLVVIPVALALLGFLIGILYFFNLQIVARYMMSKEAYPVTIDQMDISLSGDFTLERLKYIMQGPQGVEQEIKAEYISGSLSLYSLIISDQLDLDMNLRGMKLPLKDGMISGGSWKMTASINKLQKNTQAWEGDIRLSLDNAMLQYSVMETNYSALIKTGKIVGKIKNGMILLDTSEFMTDIARITLKGNSTLVKPYNLNMELEVVPLEDFGKKYPNEKSMLSAIMKNESSITIYLTGPVDRLSTRVKNFK